jgi:hypothetical protein
MAYAYINGKKTDSITAAAFKEAVRLSGLTGRVVVVQGSYSSSISASAGTHRGGGALDIRTRNLTLTERARLELNLRRVGFAAWIRDARDGFDPHIHAIRSDCGDLHWQARAQVVDYRHGRNGLANNGPDRGPDGYRLMTWSYYLKLKAQAKPPASSAPDTFPGHPRPYLFQRILLKQVNHERKGGPALTAIEKRYLSMYRSSLVVLIKRAGGRWSLSWSTYSLVRSFQIEYRLPLDGIPGTQTCQKLASLAGYAHVA